MGNLVFQAALGGQVALSGPNTASNFTVAVPAVTGTMVTTGDTGTVTSTMISGPLTTAVGGTGLASFTSGGLVYASSTSALATGSALTWDGSILKVSASANEMLRLDTSSTSYDAAIRLYQAGVQKANIQAGIGATGGGLAIVSTTSTPIVFQTNGEAGRFDSSGRLLVGTTTNVNSANKFVVRGVGDAVPLAQFYSDVTQPSSAGTTTIRASANTNTSNDSTLLWLENLNPFGSSSMASTGIKITGNTYAAAQTIFGVDAGYGGVTINRPRTDGTLIDFLRNGTSQGSITVSGSTVSYNSFAGSHWSQWIEGRGYAPLTLRGTVLSTIDEMCVWKSLSWSEEYESQDTTNDLIAATTIGQEGNTALSTKKLMVKAKPYLGNEPIGAIIIEDGIEKVVIDDGNERLPKVKVSNVVGDKRVYGVFMDYDKVQDIHVTAIGAFVVRIASGVTVNAGDLLESNGDGCAKVQADDIIKSSTIAKVTTNIVSDTYPDGSFTVPCVLYCG